LFHLNFRYLVNTYQKNEHPLRDKLEKLNDLSPQKYLIPFHEVSGLYIQPEVGCTRHKLGAILSTPRVNRHMEVALSGVHAAMYPVIAPLELRMGIALFSPSNLFYTDGWVACFAVHHTIDCNIGFQVREPTSVRTVELAAIHMAMDHIKNEALRRYLILTDSKSLIRAMESRKITLHTHSFVYEWKQKCWQLARSGREVSFMWVPGHVGNERANFEARQATLGNMVYNVQLVARDLLPVAKQRMLEKWQKIWEVAETGRFSHSRVQAHLKRFSIVDGSMCVCV
jgi:ribonuclease HI